MHHSRRHVLLPLSIVLVAIATVSTTRGEASDRPNIIVMLCDDLGYGDLGCFGHPHIQTPNLDQLAAGGIRFTDMYSAAPVCSPSRVGLLTGRSPNRAGVYDWIPEAQAGKPNRPDHSGRKMVHLRSTEVTIPGRLRDAGYQTCLAGKWHCNAYFNSDLQPQPGDFGFDHWMATQNNAAPNHQNPRNFVRNGTPVGELEGFSCQLAVDESLDWLKTINSDKPFFLYVPFHEPHEPVASPPDLVAKYRPVAQTDDEAQYFANVANVDAAVGRLMAGLDQLALRENTLVIFTSDNGPETHLRYAKAKRSYGRPGNLRGMKLHTTEAGFRVPGIMNWPAKIKPGQTVATPVSSLDFLPTFLSLGQAPVPAGLNLDGINIAPLITASQPGEISIKRTHPLIWAYYNATNEAKVAMRDGRWKVLAKLSDGALKQHQNLTSRNIDDVRSAPLTNIEIYDLETDIAESRNLAGSAQVETQALTDRINQAYAELLADSHVWDIEASNQ